MGTSLVVTRLCGVPSKNILLTEATMWATTVVMIVLLGSLLSVSEASFLLGTAAVGGITIGSGAFWTGLALLKIGAIKGLVKGSLLSGGRRGHYRGRRDVDDQLDHQILMRIDEYFSTIRDKDLDDCGKKFICDIKTRSVQELTDKEKVVSALFDPSEEFIDPNSPKAEFDLAAYMGLVSKSKSVCTQRYSKCPVEAKLLANALEKGINVKEEQ